MAGRCPVCGAPLEGNYCSYCGHKAETSASGGAGEPQPQIIIQNIFNSADQTGTSVNDQFISAKSRWVTFVLCFFLGILGIHRFYVGKIGTGILYLFTGGLFGIGWFVDIFVILFGAFKDGMGLPLKK